MTGGRIANHEHKHMITEKEEEEEIVGCILVTKNEKGWVDIFAVILELTKACKL